MVDTSLEILAILKHNFQLGLKAVEAVHRIWEVNGNETISDHTDNCKWDDMSTEINLDINYDTKKCNVEKEHK